jgi:ribosome-associated protein
MPAANRQTLAFAIEAARLLEDRHCEDVRLMDVRGLSQVCDFVLVGSGTSDRQMKAVAGELEDLGEEHGSKVFRSSRDEGGTWIVVDFVDLVTHLFEPNQRAYYDLETLWGDAAVIDWKRAGVNGEAGKKAKPPKPVSKPATSSRRAKKEA